MIWSRLKRMKCPKCDNPLIETCNGKQFGFGCSTKCTFFIGKEKFDEIIINSYGLKKRTIYNDVDTNLSELNNL